MINLKFQYQDLTIAHRDDRNKDSLSSSEKWAKLMPGFRDPLKLPESTMLVGFNIFRALKKNVPGFIKGMDSKWGEYGYGFSKNGMKIKLFESAQPVLHTCSINVLEEFEIQAFGTTEEKLSQIDFEKWNDALMYGVDAVIYIR
jgi:hypothetical protein